MYCSWNDLDEPTMMTTLRRVLRPPAGLRVVAKDAEHPHRRGKRGHVAIREDANAGT
jgi:hypothetical protein